MAAPAAPPSAAAVYAEKTYDTHLENGSNSSISKHDGAAESQPVFDSKHEKSIKRRVDFRLIPALGLMYGVSLMDRKNVSNAYIAGMRTDLNLISYRYSLITLTFFITYVLFQPPLTYLCRRIGPPGERVDLSKLCSTHCLLLTPVRSLLAWLVPHLGCGHHRLR
jgi:hypothetical protein